MWKLNSKISNSNLWKFLNHYYISQLQNIAISAGLSHPTISNFYQSFTSRWNWDFLIFFFFRLIPIPTYLFFQFLEIFINYMSISITIVSNITVLVSHNTIFYGFFMSLNHGVNKKTPSRVSPTSISLPGFQQVCLLLYKK